MPGMTARWFLGIAMGSAMCVGANCVNAQITPDATLPNNSSVTVNGNTFNITGGTTAGRNLFHSFQEFSVPTGGSAIFNNVADIQNIFSRVTGGVVSNIDGLIRANGTANLFLINPNGIILGQNARLDIGGSFFATSANSIKFADGREFNVQNPQQTPLLTINVPVGLQFGTNPGLIQVRGNGQGKKTNDSPIINTQDGLQVQPNKTLALVGGDINLEGATLKTAGGRIELGSVTGNSLVSLTSTNSGWLLGYQGITNFQNIRLTDSANIAVNGDGKGSIAINANNIDIHSGSNIKAGIDAGFQFLGNQAGDITLNASGIVSVDDGIIANEVGGIGNGGNINITGRSLFLRNGGIISANSLGQGNTGNVTINTSDISLDGVGSNRETAITATLFGTGNGGKIGINASIVSLFNGATIVAHTFGQGNAGRIEISAADDISINGVGSGVGSQVFPGAVGNGGAITMNASIVSLSNGATIVAHTTGWGNAGNIEITATDNISIAGIRSGVGSQTFAGGVGDSGKITINAPTVSLSDGAAIIAHTHTQGNAGSITINANKVFLDGVASNEDSSGVGSAAFRFARGNGGEIIINTDSLAVTNGASLFASSFGEKDAGSVTINASGAVSFDGIGANGRSSNAFSNIELGSTGNAGEIKITANSLSVKNGAIIGANTSGQGNGGNIQINVSTLEIQSGGQILTTSRNLGNAGEISVNATDSITITGSDPNFPERLARIGRPIVRGENAASGIFANTGVNSTGSGGNINVTTQHLSIKEGALVNATSQGSGVAGNINAQAHSIRLDNNATISADTRGIDTDPNKPQATINIRSRDLILSHSNISTNAKGENVIGGNINIDTDFLIAVENSDISANSEDFRGGNVRITAQGIFGTQFRDAPTDKSDITATGASPQFNGNVEIITPDIEPHSSLVELPTVPLDTQLAQSCDSGGSEAWSEFIITGRGGLPPNPKNMLTTNTVDVDWITLDPTSDNRHPPVSTQPTPIPKPIVEATGWVINDKGEVELTSSAPTIPHGSWHNSFTCRGS